MANWYTFTGCCDGVFDESKYRLSTVKPTCQVGKEICVVYLNQNSNIPSSLSTVETYIANALATQIPQPTGVGVKRFVYLRGPAS